MPKELLLEMLSRKLWMEIAATGLLYLISWLPVFALGLKILCLKIRLRAILPAALLMALYSQFGLQSLPPICFHILAALLVILLFKQMIKWSHFFQVIWIGLMAIISQAVGPVFVNTLSLLEPKTAAFWASAPGNMAVIAAGMVVPLILLVSLPEYSRITLKPFLGVKEGPKPDYQILILPGLVYAGILAGLSIPLGGPGVGSRLILDVILIWAAMAIILSACLYYLHHIRRKAASNAFIASPHRFLEMKILRRLLLDENQEFRWVHNQEPKFNDIFEGVYIRSDELSLLVDLVMEKSRRFMEPNFIHNFTARLNQPSAIEVQVMKMISRGDTNEEIAAALEIGEPQVENIITQLIKKAGVEDETALGAFIIFMDGISKSIQR